MRFLDSKWFERIFFIVSGILLIWLILAFVLGGGFISLLFIGELQEMSIWTIIRERLAFLLFFVVVIGVACSLLLATWKGRSKNPKALTIVTTVLCILIIGASVFAIIGIISFGYNS